MHNYKKWFANSSVYIVYYVLFFTQIAYFCRHVLLLQTQTAMIRIVMSLAMMTVKWKSSTCRSAGWHQATVAENKGRIYYNIITLYKEEEGTFFMFGVCFGFASSRNQHLFRGDILMISCVNHPQLKNNSQRKKNVWKCGLMKKHIMRCFCSMRLAWVCK